MLVCLLSFFYFLDLFAPRVSSLTRVCPLRNPQRSPPHAVTPDSGEDTKPSRRHNSRPPFILYGQRASEPSRRPSQHSSVPPKRATWHPRSLDPRVASPHSTRTQRPSPKGTLAGAALSRYPAGGLQQGSGHRRRSARDHLFSPTDIIQRRIPRPNKLFVSPLSSSFRDDGSEYRTCR